MHVLATFSIVACDLKAQAWGVAVASKFPAVGAVVPWARAKSGAVATQALSIPFMLVMGLSPVLWASAAAYLVRLGLMNMSNPVYQTFVMERVDLRARATVASLTSMAWNFGWAFSPTVSGWMQVEYGFGLVFVVASALYSLAILMYWRFFLGTRQGGQAVEGALAAP